MEDTQTHKFELVGKNGILIITPNTVKISRQSHKLMTAGREDVEYSFKALEGVQLSSKNWALKLRHIRLNIDPATEELSYLRASNDFNSLLYAEKDHSKFEKAAQIVGKGMRGEDITSDIDHLSSVAETTEERLKQDPTLTLLLLFFCSPIGIYMMWKKQLWSNSVRVGVSAVFAFILILLAIPSYNEVAAEGEKREANSEQASNEKGISPAMFQESLLDYYNELRLEATTRLVVKEEVPMVQLPIVFEDRAEHIIGFMRCGSTKAHTTSITYMANSESGGVSAGLEYAMAAAGIFTVCDSSLSKGEKGRMFTQLFDVERLQQQESIELHLNGITYTTMVVGGNLTLFIELDS